MTLGEADLPKILGELRDRANLQESVILSTCLRTEVYAVVDRFHDAVHEIEDVLAGKAGVSVGEVEAAASIRFDDDVAVHLFSVASGLESAVVGESEVLGQVRRAFDRAQEEGVTGPILTELFRHAVRAGRRVRTDTAIARGTTSFSHAAVALAEASREGGLGGSAAVVIGAGEMGAGVVAALAGLPEERRPAGIALANRSSARAAEVAASQPASAVVRTVPLSEVPVTVAGADVVVTTLEAGRHLFGASDLAADGSRVDRPLLVVDVGMPRNVDPSLGTVPGVTLLDMGDLSTAIGQVVEDRKGEMGRAREIVAEEVARYRGASRARGAAPVITAFRTRLEEARRAELDRQRRQFGELDDEDWSRIDAITRSVLAKVVHEPTVVLREIAGTPRGERLVEALRTLFDL